MAAGFPLRCLRVGGRGNPPADSCAWRVLDGGRVRKRIFCCCFGWKPHKFVILPSWRSESKMGLMRHHGDVGGASRVSGGSRGESTSLPFAASGALICGPGLGPQGQQFWSESFPHGHLSGSSDSPPLSLYYHYYYYYYFVSILVVLLFSNLGKSGAYRPRRRRGCSRVDQAA